MNEGDVVDVTGENVPGDEADPYRDGATLVLADAPGRPLAVRVHP